MAKTPASADTPAKPPARRLGGRSARVREAVLNATVALLSERGLNGLMIADIAARAGVHETSVYRRWGQPAKLANEALLMLAERAMPIPDTGSLRGDLIAIHVASVDYISSPLGHSLIAWAVAAPNTPEHNAAVGGYWVSRSVILKPIFDRARARGEWSSTEPMSSILPRLTGPLYFRHFLLRQPIGAKEADDMIDDFLSCGA